MVNLRDLLLKMYCLGWQYNDPCIAYRKLWHDGSDPNERYFGAIFVNISIGPAVALTILSYRDVWNKLTTQTNKNDLSSFPKTINKTYLQNVFFNSSQVVIHIIPPPPARFPPKKGMNQRFINLCDYLFSFLPVKSVFSHPGNDLFFVMVKLNDLSGVTARFSPGTPGTLPKN